MEASQTSPMDLLSELKKIRGAKNNSNKLLDMLTGKTGEDTIVNEFRSVYSKLYNMLDDSVALAELKNTLKHDIRKENSLEEIQKVTGHLLHPPGKGVQVLAGAQHSDLQLPGLHLPPGLSWQLQTISRDGAVLASVPRLMPIRGLSAVLGL